MKYTSQNTSIYLANITDWKTLKQALANEKTDFHSYTAKDEKMHAFVLSGLDNDTCIEDVENDLINNGLSIIKVYRMRSKRAPFLIIIKNDVLLRHLQQRVKIVNYTRIEKGKILQQEASNAVS